MGKGSAKNAALRDGHRKRHRISRLGRQLQKLRDEYVASGGKLLNRRELEQEIAERRGLR